MKLLLRIMAGILFCSPFTLTAQVAFYDSLNGIYWAAVEPPNVEDFSQCRILSEGFGYVLGKNGTLYEYDAARPLPWRSLPRPESYRIQRFFALSPNDVWAIVEVPAAFRHALFYWNGARWSVLPSPNVYTIRDVLFVSRDEGWIGCEYGEMWHFFKGRWEQEELPTQIHVNRLRREKDGNLFAICEAPQQGALLRRSRGKWQTLLARENGQIVALAMSPAQILFFGFAGGGSDSFYFAGRPARQAPVRRLEFFPNGAGYGLGEGEAAHNLFLLRDTTYYPLAPVAGLLEDLALFNQKFSWLVGPNGLILAPTDRPGSSSPPAPRAFDFASHDIFRVYGMAVLQDRPGIASRIYFARPGVANLAYRLENLRSKTNLSDQAEALNIAGPGKYDDRHSSMDALINYDQGLATGDLNGDGRDDIIVTGMYGHPFVYFHSGHDYYFDATKYSGLNDWGYVQQRPMLANLFDADHDGDLDLFIACQYRSNAFFINNGRGRFTEVAEAAGLSTDDGGIGGYVADFDGDDWDDLFVTRLNRPNLLYRNRGPDSLTGLPRFKNVGAESGAACPASLKQSQGAAIADYDNDGDFDIFVCNLAQQNQLLQNNGNGYFADVTAAAGLAGNDLSVGAVFFDADHDGDLDLLLANRGADRFYKNLGAGRFVERSDDLGRGDFFKGLILDNSRQLGGYSYGTLAVDIDEDGDQEVLLGNYDTGLFVFKNGLNQPASAIQIFPEGLVSNRSAIGAKIFLYRAGKAGRPDSLAGTRQIESANGFGCSPAKLAHFGVAPGEIYNARVVFPSGIVQEVHGLRGGESRVVAEMDALPASFKKTRRALADLFLGYRSRQRALAFVLGAVGLVLLLAAAQKFVGLSREERKWLAAIFAAALLACQSLWFARSETVFVLRPPAVGLILTAAAIIYRRDRRLAQTRAASIEMLQIRLNAFGHGSLIHQLMDRLALFAENLEADGELTAEARLRLRETVAGLQHFLAHEIRAILSYQYGNNFALELAARLETLRRRLKKALAELQRQLAAEEKLGREQFVAAAALQKELRALIPEIQQRLQAAQRIDLAATVADFIRQKESAGLRLAPAPHLPPVGIAAADFIYALDELVQNALQNPADRPPQIDIVLQAHLDDVQIDVIDNGIPENQWEEIFRFGFTTKAGGKGGFGLYHARQRLAKYGGKIFVAASEIGRGTTMRICLKAAAL